jgi:DNA-binding PadR family transcriptional regulator
VKLTPAAYLVLGMLRLGASTGYAIKKAADVSTRHFWPTSLAQVYPQLAALEDGGLVTRRDNPRGRRARSDYAITPKGEEALLAWLRSARQTPFKFRDEGVLRLFFADAVPAEDQLTLVRRLRERAQVAGMYMRDEILPAAEEIERAGVNYPGLVARLGADTYDFISDWLERYEDEMEGKVSHSSGTGARTRRHA